MGFLTKLFGTNMAKEIKRIDPIVRKIEALEEEYKRLTDAQLQAKTAEFKERYQKGETLDDLLPEAFATCREAADRVLGLRPYRVQLIGGVILHQGRIAEMKTGEGKTLVAIVNLPPRKMMGIDSCGMLISAVHHENGEEKLHLLMVDPHIPAGAKLY